MARVKPAPYIDSVSGKVTERSTVYYRTNRRTGKIYAVERPRQNSVPQTDRQRRRCEIFAEQTRAAGRWMRENRPSPEHPDGTPDYQRLRHAYEHQHKVGTILAFLRKHMDDDCNVVLDPS